MFSNIFPKETIVVFYQNLDNCSRLPASPRTDAEGRSVVNLDQVMRNQRAADACRNQGNKDSQTSRNGASVNLEQNMNAVFAGVNSPNQPRRTPPNQKPNTESFPGTVTRNPDGVKIKDYFGGGITIQNGQVIGQ